MKVLVAGGTGTVGSRVVETLRRRGIPVRCLTHSREKAGTLPAGVEPAIGDLERPDTLSEAFRGPDALFLLVGLARNETEQGLAAVEAAKRSGIRKIVYMSVVLPPDSLHIPHFASKVPIEQAVESSGLEWTILRPNNFFQNDEWSRAAILDHGVYPQPIGSVGVNRVDVRDVAAAAANALTQAGHAGKKYPLSGPDSLTGEDVARAYSLRLGRPVRYVGDHLDAWAQQSAGFLPDWLLADLRVMYEYFQKRGLGASPEDLALGEKAVGHPLRSFDAYVAECAAAWKRAKAAGQFQ